MTAWIARIPQGRTGRGSLLLGAFGQEVGSDSTVPTGGSRRMVSSSIGERWLLSRVTSSDTHAQGPSRVDPSHVTVGLSRTATFSRLIVHLLWHRCPVRIYEYGLHKSISFSHGVDLVSLVTLRQHARATAGGGRRGCLFENSQRQRGAASVAVTAANHVFLGPSRWLV